MCMMEDFKDRSLYVYVARLGTVSFTMSAHKGRWGRANDDTTLYIQTSKTTTCGDVGVCLLHTSRDLMIHGRVHTPVYLPTHVYIHIYTYPALHFSLCMSLKKKHWPSTQVITPYFIFLIHLFFFHFLLNFYIFLYLHSYIIITIIYYIYRYLIIEFSMIYYVK